MCRNIRTLYNFDPPATDDEIRAASLQFVRKISGFARPSASNAAAFERAVDDVATIAAPHDRATFAARARARAEARFAKPADH
jgi:hypothetical protein